MVCAPLKKCLMSTQTSISHTGTAGAPFFTENCLVDDFLDDFNVSKSKS